MKSIQSSSIVAAGSLTQGHLNGIKPMSNGYLYSFEWNWSNKLSVS